MTREQVRANVVITHAGEGTLFAPTGNNNTNTIAGTPPGAGAASSAAASRAPAFGGSRVFVVHGRAEPVKLKTARLIERLGLTAVIFHEQVDAGQTIIEKFERLSDVAFAVVVLAGDDVGRLGGDADATLRPRARQNVIFELGYFLARLGRARVCAVVEPDVEIPSDYQGVLLKTVDAGGAWEYALAREMKAAGLPVDMNKVAE